MAFEITWTENEPTDETYIREGDDWIRRLAHAVRERLAVEHYALADETGHNEIGKHKPGSAKVLAGTAATKPANDSSAPGTLYFETDTGLLMYDTGGSWGELAKTPAKMQVDIQAAVATYVNTLFPRGVIIMWSGLATDVPAGWHLCDGTEGTPDLRDKFIVGAGAAYAVGATGGAASVALGTEHMPSHTHSASSDSAGDHNHGGATSTGGLHTHSVKRTSWANFGTSDNNYYGLKIDGVERAGEVVNGGSHSHSIPSGGSHTHLITVGASGGGAAHENRPPYYALCFIMKL